MAKEDEDIKEPKDHESEEPKDSEEVEDQPKEPTYVTEEAFEQLRQQFTALQQELSDHIKHDEEVDHSLEDGAGDDLVEDNDTIERMLS